MPLFDFVCEACNHVWEDMHRTGEPIPACPSCGSSKTEKRLTIGSAYAPIEIKRGVTYEMPKPNKRRKRTYNF